LGEPRRHTERGSWFLLLLTAALALVFAIPVALVVWLALWLGHALADASWMLR
jgi:hypothetical protein